MLAEFESIVTEHGMEVIFVQEAVSMNSDLSNDIGVTTGIDSFFLAC